MMFEIMRCDKLRCLQVLIVQMDKERGWKILEAANFNLVLIEKILLE